MEEEIIKIAIIHGESLVNKEYRNGEIDYLTCTLNDEYFHIVLMLKYLEKNIIDGLENETIDIYTAINKIAIILANAGEMVFLNTTNYREDIIKVYGKKGIFIMPDQISQNQKESLKKLKEKILDFDEIQIWYDVKNDYTAQMIYGDLNVIDHFISERVK